MGIGGPWWILILCPWEIQGFTHGQIPGFLSPKLSGPIVLLDHCVTMATVEYDP